MKKHIFSQELVFRMAHELRKQGKIVGLTHGTYDLLHCGHIDQLNKSADKCDFLIVGIESDEAVQSYKGEFRPIISQQDRLKVVSSVAPVDAVFIKEKEQLSEQSLIDLYKEISPSFVSIGRKFSGEDLIRGCAERANTLLMKFNTIQPEIYTTDIIERVLSKEKEKELKEREWVKPPRIQRGR